MRHCINTAIVGDQTGSSMDNMHDDLSPFMHPIITISVL